jgi:hypothetical protein
VTKLDKNDTKVLNMTPGTDLKKEDLSDSKKANDKSELIDFNMTAQGLKK